MLYKNVLDILVEVQQKYSSQESLTQIRVQTRIGNRRFKS